MLYMSAARAYSELETLIGGKDRDARRRDRFIDRISNRAGKEIDKGETIHEVRGGLFGISQTLHDVEVYEGVAERLWEEREDPAVIEVHRMQGRIPMPIPDFNASFPGPEVPFTYDLLVVRSVGGVATHQALPQEDGHVARIYPPETQ